MPPWNSEAAAKAKKLAGRSLYTLGTGLCKAGGAVAKAAVSGYQTLTADHSDKEKVCFCRVAELEWSDQCGEHRLPVCLVGYDTGFQIWSLEGKDPDELVSIRRDGAVRWLEPVPPPRLEDPQDGPLAGARPVVVIVPSPNPGGGVNGGGGKGGQHAAQHRVQLYSLRTQGYVKSLAFSSEVLGVLCSTRVVVVALRGQLQAFDAVSLEHTFSCLTYCPPPSRQPSTGAQQQGLQQQGLYGGQVEGQEGGGAPLVGAPCALGPRWLAYAADQAVQASGSQARAQRLPLHRRDSTSSSASSHLGMGPLPASRASSGLEPAGSMGNSGSPSGGLASAAMTEVAKEYAVKSGQQLAAGLAAAGSASVKYLSTQYRHWRSGAQQGAVAAQGDASVGGTVMVRDVVTRQVVAHFRAHASALATLAFSPDGTLLATASTAGHNVNVFRIMPPPPSPLGATAGLDGLEAAGLGGQGTAGYAVHLLRLHRGMTPTTIQTISFSPDASWAAVTSGRGTHHVFYLAGPGSPLATRASSAALGDPALPLQPSTTNGMGAAAGLEAGLQDGVTGQPLRLTAAGRAAGGRPGLLSSGIAGAASQAALSVYGQQTVVVPAAAAFMPTKPGSPRAVLTSPHLAGPEAANGSSSSALSLVVLSCEGLLTRHMLRTPGVAEVAPRMGQHYAAANGGLRSESQAAEARPVAALQEEARWDICRQHGWQEREEIPASFLPPLGHAQAPMEGLGGLGPSGCANSGHVLSDGRGVAVADPSWLSQAEAAPPLDSAMGPPLWADPQFRFVGVPGPQQARHIPQHQPWPQEGLAGSPGPGSFGRSPPLGTGPSSLQGMPSGLLAAAGAVQHGRPSSSLSSASSGAAGMHWDGY